VVLRTQCGCAKDGAVDAVVPAREGQRLDRHLIKQVLDGKT